MRLVLLLLTSLVVSLAGCDSAPDPPETNECTPVASTNGQVGEWEFLGLGGEDIGDISAIAVSPCDPRVIYAGSSADFSGGIPGRIFKSTDGGATWDTLFTGSTQGGGVSDIEVDPHDPKTVYALPGGVIKSTDGGQTWQDLSEDLEIPTEDTRALVLEVDPTNPKILYLGATGFFGGALYKTDNGGAEWKVLGQDVARLDGVASVTVSPKNPATVYVGAGSGDLFKSTDGGQTWELTGLRRTRLDVQDVSIDAQQPNRLYAAVEENGIMTSKDGGATWQSLNEGLPENGLVVEVEKSTKELFLVHAHEDSGQVYRREESLESVWSSYGVDSLEGQSHYSSSLQLMAEARSLYFGLNGVYRVKLATRE